jgi:hypothetical protein
VLARTLVLQATAACHEVAVGACASGESGVPDQNRPSPRGPVVVDQGEHLLFEGRNLILGLKRFGRRVSGWQSQSQ